MADAIDTARSQWAALLPSVDTTPLDVFGRIRRINDLLQERSDSVLASHGVSRSDFDILSVLSRFERPMTLGEVATETLTSAPGTTKRVKRLTAAGLILRESNPDDGRGALVSLTAESRSLIEPVIVAISALEQRLLADLTVTENKALVAALRQVLASVESSAAN